MTADQLIEELQDNYGTHMDVYYRDQDGGIFKITETTTGEVEGKTAIILDGEYIDG